MGPAGDGCTSLNAHEHSWVTQGWGQYGYSWMTRAGLMACYSSVLLLKTTHTAQLCLLPESVVAAEDSCTTYADRVLTMSGRTVQTQPDRPCRLRAPEAP